MTQRTSTLLGLTVPQFFSLVSFLIAVISIWVHMEIRLAEINVEIINMKQDLVVHKSDNRKDMDLIRSDIKADNNEILGKIDQIQLYILNSK
jgi:hypothetical protein